MDSPRQVRPHKDFAVKKYFHFLAGIFLLPVLAPQREIQMTIGMKLGLKLTNYIM